MLVALLASCSGGDKPYSHAAARRAAQEYYSYLISGDYDSFAAGIALRDSLYAGMRQELADMSAQFVHGQSGRNAMVRAVAVDDSLFEDSTADVFLELVFADSTRELICLPMVLEGDTWRMR